MTMSQPTIVVTVLLGIATLLVDRKYVLVPFLLVACFIPADQRVIVSQLDFTPLRILVVMGVLRCFIRSEPLLFKINTFDKLVFAWSLCAAAVYVLQWATTGALIYKCGTLFDVIGLYVLFRRNVRSWANVRLTMSVFAVFCIASGVLVIIERVMQVNPFHAFGKTLSGMHYGRYRCAGAFPHYIILGLFWANLVPLFLAYGITEASKRMLWYGAAVCGGIIAVLSGSSTPIMTLGTILVIFYLFRHRYYGRVAAWGLLACLTALHIVMKNPVWHLLARVNVFSGSTGWHRYHLINEAVNHFGEWALLGCRSTRHWGYGLDDVTNQFILEGVRGGLISLLLFVALLVYGIRCVWLYCLRHLPKKQQRVAWAICVLMLGHCVSFIGVSYFGQIMMLLYLSFAMLGMVCDMSAKPSTLKETVMPAKRGKSQYGSIHRHRQLEHTGYSPRLS